MTKKRTTSTKPKETVKKGSEVNLGRVKKSWQPVIDKTTTPPSKKDKK